jgi:uncharacterized protein YndB with AHSA1/START domain
MGKTAFAFLILLFCSLTSQAQVVNRSYKTQSGEQVLRFEFTVPLNKKAAWELFTTDEQLVKWIAPRAHIELRTGGYVLTNYNKDKPLSDSTSIKLDIVNYLEKQLITFKVNLNNAFSKKLQQEDGNLQELVQFVEEGPNKTRIISSMIGWGQGEDWDKAYGFFVKGNEWSYQELLKLFPK